jgi:hypothetical protein
MRSKDADENAFWVFKKSIPMNMNSQALIMQRIMFLREANHSLYHVINNYRPSEVQINGIREFAIVDLQPTVR